MIGRKALERRSPGGSQRERTGLSEWASLWHQAKRQSLWMILLLLRNSFNKISTFSRKVSAKFRKRVSRKCIVLWLLRTTPKSWPSRSEILNQERTHTHNQQKVTRVNWVTQVDAHWGRVKIWRFKRRVSNSMPKHLFVISKLEAGGLRQTGCNLQYCKYCKFERERD